MPNWCQNEVTIYAESEMLQHIKDLVGGSRFDFNRVIPMPAELANTHTGATTLEVDGGERRVTTWREDAEGNRTPVDEADLVARFGAKSWYAWALANWGTRSNVHDEDVLTDEGDDFLRYDFDTAWGPPEGVCEKLRELFPEACISWFYREDGEQIAGFL